MEDVFTMTDQNTPAGRPRLSRRYADFCLRHRTLIIALVALLTLLGAWYVPQVDVRNDPDTLLPPENRYVATNAYAEEHFGMGNLMVVGLKVKEGTIYQPWFINLVQEIHHKLELLPDAIKANFLSLAAQKVKYMGADANGLVFKRLIPTAGIDTKDPAHARQQLSFLKEGLEDNPVLAPMMLYMEGPKGEKCTMHDGAWPKGCVAKGTFIVADYTDAVKPIYLPWVTEVRHIIEHYNKDPRYEILVAGEPYFLAYMLYNLVQNWWLFVISVLIVLVVLWLELRNWRGAVFPLVGVGVTITWTLGLMGYSQFKLTTMMVLTPMLLLAIGIGHSVQITRRFSQELARHKGNCMEAAAVSIEHTIIPATLSALVNMVGFATLGLVPISFYQDYAYFGVFGMATLLLTTTTLIPMMMVMLPCKGQAEAQLETGHEWERSAGSFMSRVIAGPGKWVPLGIVAAMIAVSTHYNGLLRMGHYKVVNGEYVPAANGRFDLMPGVERGINYSRAAFKADAPTVLDINELSKIMPGVISLNIPIRGKERLKPECDMQGKPAGCWDVDTQGQQGVINDADVLHDMAALEDWLRKNPYIGFTGSYAQYIKLVNMLLAADPGQKPKYRDFAVPTTAYLRSIDPNDDRDPNAIVTLYNGLLQTMTGPGELSSFVDDRSKDRWNQAVVLGFVNTMDPRKTHQVVKEIQDYIEQHKNDAGFRKVNFGLRNGDESGDTNQLSRPGPHYLEPGIGGFLGATEATWEVAQHEWLRGPLTTALAVLIIAALVLRSFSTALILIFIMLITLYTQYGMAGYFTSVENWSGNLHFANLVALSIAMGLGLDYGIYLVLRMREEMQANGGDWPSAIRETLGTTGSAVLISVVVLLGSFIPLVGTQLANTWGLGIYIGEALLVDVFTALFLLPLMIGRLRPAFVFRAGPG
jgi:uncharacterized protein